MSSTTRMRTISISVLSKMMSNKAGFGRSAEDFLRLLGQSANEDGQDGGIKITAVCPCSDRCLEVRISISSGDDRNKSEMHEFILLEELVESLEISVGSIEPELMPEIEYFSHVTRAYFSACSSFAFAPSSLRGLERKLVQKGFDADVARDAIGYIFSRGVVDEAEVAVRRFELMVKKLWGMSRIMAKLREEGFSAESLASVDQYIANVDFSANCALLIEKKFGCFPSDRAERDKMLASLSRYGYSMSEIKKAISILK